jgi:ESS family glutamate:Na+ symporter
MEFNWAFFIDLGIISLALLLATLIRAKIKFFQRFLIPNALTAGFLLLLFYNFLAPLLGLSSDGLGPLVYHLLAISFVAMTLRKSDAPKEKDSVGVRGTTVVVAFQYAIQALIGLLLTFFFIKTVLPDLFPAFGVFVPLGFALGPGQSYTFGYGWETNYGFVGGSSVGLTFAAIGFLLACFGGVFLIHLGRKRGWLEADSAEPQDAEKAQENAQGRGGVCPPGIPLKEGSRQTTEPEAIDTMSANLGMVLLVYLLGFLSLKLITFLLSMAGDMGSDLAASLWNINFVFATLIAMLVKLILVRFGAFHILDNGSLTRISGTAVDVMVAGAVGAISLVVVGQYWLPIVVIAVAAGAIVFPTVLWLSSRIFTRHRFKRAVIIYGAMTGTLPTGLALLRVLDPELKSPVANDYVYATATIFVLLIPLILAIDWPARSTLPGKGIFFWLTVLMAAAYLVISLVLYRIWAKDRAFRKPSQLWYRS